MVPVWRPKWHMVYRFWDGGLFKFWALDDSREAIIFREKVGFWVRSPREEAPWSVQDRIDYMTRTGEQKERISRMKVGDLHVWGAVDWQIEDWLEKHPKERLVN